MEVVSKVVRMRALVEDMRRQGRPVGFVPTMGALHEGHLSLVRQARERGADVVVSIFVNPTQFENERDLEAYPTDLTRDCELLVKEGVKVLFSPTAEEIYPSGDCTRVEVTGLTEPMLGVTRPGHLLGVTTVVTKLFNIVQPDFAVFGWKDAQQLIVIRRMVEDLRLPVEVVGAPTVREADGLACSSRNAHLSDADRRVATALYRGLQEGSRLVSDGSRDPAAVAAAVRGTLEEQELLSIDHVEVVSAEDLSTLKRLSGLVLIAASVVIQTEAGRSVRLLDNVRIDVDDEP